MVDEVKFSDETFVRIHDGDGNFWQVGPDQDSLGLCEITYYEGDDPKPMKEMRMPWEAAVMLSRGIQTTYNENRP